MIIAAGFLVHPEEFATRIKEKRRYRGGQPGVAEGVRRAHNLPKWSNSVLFKDNQPRGVGEGAAMASVAAGRLGRR